MWQYDVLPMTTVCHSGEAGAMDQSHHCSLGWTWTDSLLFPGTSEEPEHHEVAV